MTEPLLRRLAARGEQLCVGAVPWVAPVYRLMPQVAEVIEFPFTHGRLQLRARRRLAQQIQGRFDTAYVCPNSAKSALLPLLAGIPRRVGYLGEARVGLLTDRLKNPPKGRQTPMVEHYGALSGETDLVARRPQLRLSQETLEAALTCMGLRHGSYYLFAPGAEYGPAKRWPVSHFAELAALLDAPVVLLGSEKEFELCQAIAVPVNAKAPGQCLNLAGKTTLERAFCAIAATKLIVSNDSGLMHVGAALGVAQVALFGSSSPVHTPPLNDRASVLWLKNDPHYQPALECAPCFARNCRFGHTRCLGDISVAQVLQAMTQGLKSA